MDRPCGPVTKATKRNDKFWRMVRSGERPDSANTDWLASQNDSFTVALFTVFRFNNAV